MHCRQQARLTFATWLASSIASRLCIPTFPVILQATEDERQLLCSAPADSLVGLVHCRLLEVVSEASLAVYSLCYWSARPPLTQICFIAQSLRSCAAQAPQP